MKVLVINAGSSSLKYQLINTEDESVLAKGNCERIGLEDSFLKHTPTGKETINIPSVFNNHTDAIKKVLKTLVSDDYGVIKGMDEIDAVGHRIVHGGESFAQSVVIDDEVMDAIEANVEVAPLHNPPNIMGIEACKSVMPNTPMVAVFDTAFHQTMPKKAYFYGLPYELYEKYSIRRYGFHGTSHKYVALRAAKLLNEPIDSLKIITCHLGNGSSITAINKGKSIDTSMGFTPLEGLPMGTRSGTIDPAIVTYLMDKENLSCDDMDRLLNKDSGVMGISGVSSDFRDLEEAAINGNERAKLALDVFCYQVKKYIGAYTAALGGVDCIIFTAGIGENTPNVRAEACKGLEFMGIKIDPIRNKNTVGSKQDEGLISTDDSVAKVLVIPTNEELMIARETVGLLHLIG